MVECVWAFRSGQWRADTHLRFGLILFSVAFVVLSAARFKRADYLLPAAAEGPQVEVLIVAMITAHELIGPVLTRRALERSGEVHSEEAAGSA